MPKVTVIIPCYNVASQLVDCLNDLKKQSLKDIEIIFINDGSTDKTLEILLNFSKQDKRVTILSSVNRGVSAARNIGIRAANAPYLFFFDPDDRIDPDFLDKLYHKISSKHFDLVKSSYVRVDKYGRKTKSDMNERLEKSPHSLLDLNSEWIGALYSKDLINKYDIRFPEHIRYKEDVAFLFCYTSMAKRLGLVDTTTYYYNFQRQGSASNTLYKSLDHTISKLSDSILGLEFRIDFLNSYNFDEYKYNYLFFRTLKGCFNYLKNPLYIQEPKIKEVVLDFLSRMPSKCLDWEKLKLSFPDQIYEKIENLDI